MLTACVAPLPYDQRVPKTATYQKVDAQWHDELASGAARIDGLGLLQRLVGRGYDEGVEFARIRDARVEMRRHFLRRKVALGHAIADVFDGHFAKFGHNQNLLFGRIENG